VELGHCADGERRWQSEAEGEAAVTEEEEAAGVSRTSLQFEKIPGTPP
jgi:hypothetical protein